MMHMDLIMVMETYYQCYSEVEVALFLFTAIFYLFAIILIILGIWDLMDGHNE